MLVDEPALQPRRDVFALSTPHPDVALETLRRAILRIAFYLGNDADDRSDLRAAVQAVQTMVQGLVTDVRGQVAVLQASNASLRSDVSKLQSDVLDLKTKLGLPL